MYEFDDTVFITPEQQELYRKASEERRVLRLIIRDMSLFIDLNEKEILLFIFNRTYCFGKTEERIGLGSFINGVYDKEDVVLAPPVKMSESSIYRAIKGLLDKNIVRRKRGNTRLAPIYSINTRWNCSDYSHPWESLPPPVTVITPTSGGYNIRDRTKEIRNSSARTRARTRALSNSQELDNDGMGIRETVDTAIASATARTAAAQETKKTKGNATSYEKHWQSALAIAMPEEHWFPWTNAQKASFKQALDRGVPVGDREAFIIFAVSKFVETISSTFAWMKQPPTVPHSGFVTKNIVLFWQAFENDRDPNRRLAYRVRNTETTKSENVVTPDPANDNRVKQLEEENAKLQATVRKVKTDAAVSRRQSIKTLIRAKPRMAIRDDEFEYRDK